MKASHLLSDAVYFAGSVVDVLEAQYTAWMAECTDRLANEQLPPVTRVILIDRGHGCSYDDLRSQFDLPGNAGTKLEFHVVESLQSILALAVNDGEVRVGKTAASRPEVDIPCSSGAPSSRHTGVQWRGSEV